MKRFLAIGALAVVGVAGIASAAEPTTQDLMKRIDALQAEVDQLKSAPHPEVTSADRQAAIDKIEADATKRSQLLVPVDPMTLGYSVDRGLILQSDDGRFLIHPLLIMQFRNESTYRQDGKSGDTDIQNGFEMRRLKLGVDGNVFGPDLTFQFIGSVDRHTGTFSLEDAWARYHIPDTSLFVRGGQIRDPLDHEQIILGTSLLTAERSLVDSIFANGDGIVQGVTLGFDNDGQIRTEAGLTDGLRSLDTNYEDFPNPGSPADWGAAGRVDWKLFGDWKNYRSFTALGVKNPLLVFGGALDYTESGDTGQLTQVADVSYKTPEGMNLFAAYLGRYVSNNDGTLGTNGGATGNGATSDTYDATFRLQAGYLVTPKFEPYARYEYLHFDDAEVPATADHSYINEITLGANYYVIGQRVRFVGEVSYLPNGSPIADDSSGVLPSNSGELILRLQFQLFL